MMNFRKKLNSNSGASMILALALLLICMMVSSVIIVSASSGSTRLNNRTAKQREYFAISSAAKYVASNLVDVGQFVATDQHHANACEPYKNYVEDFSVNYNQPNAHIYKIENPQSYIDGKTVNKFYLVLLGNETFCTPNEESKVIEGEGATMLKGAFAELIKDASFEVFKNRADRGFVYEKDFYLSVENESERLPQVVCKFKMTSNYRVTVEISSYQGVSDYSMTVRMDANPASSDVVRENTSCSHRYFYSYEDGVGNIKYVYPAEKWELTDQVTCETTTITWQKPEIMKGVE